MITKIILGLLGIIFIIWISGIIWSIKPYKTMTWFFHGIMGWHRPDDSRSFDGCSNHSHCRFCKREIMEDSQGNWFMCD